MSLIFDNVDDYAITNTPPVTASPLTMCLWAYPNGFGAVDYLASLCDVNNATVIQCFALRITVGGQLEMLVSSATGNSEQTNNTTSTFQTGAWNHCALVVNSDSDRRVVLNGNWTESGSSTVSKTPAGITDLLLGISPAMDLDGTPSYLLEFSGRMAHLAIWNVALSQSQIESLAAGANPTSILSGNLVWYAPMTDSGSVAVDEISANNLTLVNNTAYNADNPTVDAPSSAVINKLRGPFGGLLSKLI